MHHRTPVRRRLVAAAAALSLLGLPMLMSPADAARSLARADGPAPAVKVMTRNVYLGADIMRPIAAINSVDSTDPTCQGTCYQAKVLNAFGNANDATQDIAFEDTDFTERVTLLAGELASAKPDLVGLQEVALWRSDVFEDPLENYATFATPNAQNVDYDFLEMLLAELEAQDTPYRALSVNTLSDVEGPAFEGHYGQSDFANARDVRLTMRDVILVRKGSDVSYVRDSATAREYETNMPPIQVAGKSIEFVRGYQWVDMRADGRKFRFINTHLEAFSSDVAFAQAKEMLTGPGAFDGRTIIVCDCNSDPLNGTVKEDIGDEKKHWAPYRLIVKKEFHDTWLQWADAEEGWTSGLSETVDDPDASGFDHRIDMVFARNANGGELPVRSGDVTGNEVEDRNAEGLWPSDHAGVVMKLRLR